ncbi:hypothetical protein LB467_18100 [Salegentibacter sp. JZCK2]|uniref:hypothetical protein n=1 Tax=Salegentibacter tibetensis TaxID=2873600 RepID=UPI001CCD5E72|nr:hypothetical protein [Salegentibacter tibetensis]MBZ9731603.1 hypothetical protein [Salegentibacter tibetensis]
MNVYIDIYKTKTNDWNTPCYGATYMQFNKLPKKGDIIEHLFIVPEFARNNDDLKNVPEGSFEVLSDAFPISDNPYNCSHKIMVCSTQL